MPAAEKHHQDSGVITAIQGKCLGKVASSCDAIPQSLGLSSQIPETLRKLLFFFGLGTLIWIEIYRDLPCTPFRKLMGMTPISIHPIYLNCPSPEARREALCHIYLKIVATLTASREVGWVAVDPPSVALSYRLEVLGIIGYEAGDIWTSLLARQWIELSANPTDTRVRLTPLGRAKVAVCPSQLLPQVPRWYAIILEYLYKEKLNTPHKTPQIDQERIDAVITERIS
jgi:hypothetical protein